MNCTAAQNKEKDNKVFDSVGELVAMCEKKGFIPRYCTDISQDKIDFTLKDMNAYLKRLVTEDLGFGAQIEDAIKKLQIQKELEEKSDNDLYYEEDENELNMKHYEEYFEEQNKQVEEDLKIYNGVG